MRDAIKWDSCRWNWRHNSQAFAWISYQVRLSFQASDVDLYVTHAYDFLSKFEVVKREFVEFVRRIDQKLVNVSIEEALPKGIT